MRKVVTYGNTKQFYTSFRCQPHELHIVQSSAFATLIERQQEGDDEAFTYLKVLQRALPQVYSVQGEIVLRAKIRSLLVERMGDQFDRAFVDEYVKMFLFLFLCGPLSLSPSASHSLEQHFAAVYEQLWQDEDIRQWRQAMQQMTKEKLALALRRSPITTVIVHHFDFLDLPRLMLFNWLEDMGLTIVYYIPFRAQQEQLFHVWHQLYAPDVQEQRDCAPVNGAKLLAYIERQQGDNIVDRNVAVRQYRSLADFKRHVQSLKQRGRWPHIAAYNSDDLNSFSSLVTETALRATKQGMFFVALARCYWRTEQDVYMEYSSFVKLITSGWIAKGEQAETLLHDLAPYMDGVTSLVEIGQRLHKLVELQEVSGEFDEMAKELTGRHRMKQYLSNPFRALPFVHQHRYSITVKQLLDCARELLRKLKLLLLPTGQRIQLSDYMERLRTLYEDVSSQWPDETKEAFHRLFHRAIPQPLLVQQEEIMSYLTMLSAAREMSHEIVISHDQLIGAVLCGGDVHVTGLSLQTFPWKEPKLLGCLTVDWLTAAIEASFATERKAQLLQALKQDTLSRQLNQERAIYTLYHTIAYTTGKVTFSYIDGLQANDAMSIYLKIIANLYETEVMEPVGVFQEPLSFANLPAVPSLTWPTSHLEQLPDVAWLDKDFCVKKFYLNHCVEAHPVYEADLHQQIVFVIICRLLSEQADGEESVREFIFPLFPQWSDAQKDNLLLRAFRQPLRQYKAYGNIYYPKAMAQLQRLFSHYEVTKRWKARDEYKKDSIDARQHIQDIEKIGIHAEPGKHCAMCPFQHTCIEGGYVLDNRYA